MFFTSQVVLGGASRREASDRCAFTGPDIWLGEPRQHMCTVLTPEENGGIIDADYVCESRSLLKARLLCSKLQAPQLECCSNPNIYASVWLLVDGQ